MIFHLKIFSFCFACQSRNAPYMLNTFHVLNLNVGSSGFDWRGSRRVPHAEKWHSLFRITRNLFSSGVRFLFFLFCFLSCLCDSISVDFIFRQSRYCKCVCSFHIIYEWAELDSNSWIHAVLNETLPRFWITPGVSSLSNQWLHSGKLQVWLD